MSKFALSDIVPAKRFALSDVQLGTAVDPDPPMEGDPPTISFSTADRSVAEIAETYTARISLSAVHHRDIDVTLAAGGTATHGVGNDWLLTDTALTIRAGDMYVDAGYEIFDDATTEGDETATISITAAVEVDGLARSVAPVLPYVHTATILANDPGTPAPIVQFDTSGQSIEEGADPQTVLLVLDDAPTAPVEIVMAVKAGATATIDEDFTFPLTATAGVGQQVVPLTLTVLTDGTSERVESATIEIVSATGSGATVAASPANEYAIRIVDTPPVEPILSWTSPTFDPVAEAGGVTQRTLRVQVENPSLVTSTVGFQATITATSGAGFATAQFPGQTVTGADYTVSTQVVAFSPGQTSRDVTIEAINDPNVEGTETVELTLGSAVGCSIGGVPTITGDIIDDDGVQSGEDLRPTFVFPSEVLGSMVKPYGTTNTAAVQIHRTHQEAVTVTYEVYSPDGARGVDFGVAGTTANSVTIEPGSTSANIDLTVPSTPTNQKRFVIQMLTTTAGQLGFYDRFVGVVLGSGDTQGLIPPAPTTPVTAQDDFRVYTDRVEELRGTGAVQTTYTLPYQGSSNGLGIAGRLAALLHAERNPLPVRWMDEGAPVYIRVMEDLPSTNSIEVNDSSGHRENNPLPYIWYADFDGTPLRDIWVIGDTSRKTVGPLAFAHEHERNGGVRIPAWYDNLHFVDLEFKCPSDVQYCVTSRSNGDTTSRSWAGLVYFEGCKTSKDFTGPASSAGFKQNMRFDAHASFDIRDHTFMAAHEHAFYSNQVTGLLRLYNSTSTTADDTGAIGNGRSFAQVVARPLERSGGPAFGLAAFVGNTIGRNPSFYGTSARQFSIYGFCGAVFFRNNEHQWQLQQSGEVDRTVGFGYVFASGNQNGMYVFEYPATSGNWVTTKYASIDGEISNVPNTGTWNSEVMVMTGCAYLDVGGVTATSYKALAGRALWSFNESGVFVGPAYDQFDGPTPNRSSAHNTPGNVVFVGAVATAGDPEQYLNGGSARGGAGPYSGHANALGSTVGATHRLIGSGLFASQTFESIVPANTAAYDGTDLT